MIDYPFSTISINHREVELAEIVSSEVIAQSEFEKNTFSFIRDWMNGEKEFHQNTSGSTGIPKLISISRLQMIASAELTEAALQLQAGFNALVCLDTQYIAGKMMLVRCFVTGMKIIAIDPTANPLREILLNQKIDFAAFVPYQVQEIISSDHASRLNAIQFVIIGGAPLDNETKVTLQTMRCQCYATYGMTETVSHIALRKLNGHNSSEYFETLAGVEIRLDNRNCLVIQSPNFKDEIHTNDIVEIVSANEFRLIGRYDNVINSGGVKISPEKLEIEIGKIFKKLKIDRLFFVAGIPDKKLGEKIVLVVQGDKLNDQASAEINSMLKHCFPVYEVPKEISYHKNFIFTPTNKINRQKTIDSFQKQLQ